MDGKISYSSFISDVKEIIHLSEELKDKWEIQSCQNGSKEISFLVKRNVVHHLPREHGPGSRDSLQRTSIDQSHDQSHDLNEENGDSTEIPAEDTNEFTPTNDDTNSEVLQAEYHIIYNPSYSVPVLYFTACKSDGRLLSLEEAWRMVPASYEQRLKQERWTFLTQQEHPYLGRPFFQLHPCHTADLMEAALASHSSGNYVVTWLSSVGPVVRLNLPLAFASLCKR